MITIPLNEMLFTKRVPYTGVNRISGTGVLTISQEN
jgi:hypothetical protein